MVGDVVKNRIDAQRDSMVAQVTEIFPDLTAAEEATRSLLAGWGVSVTLYPSYLAFARKCYKITNNHIGTTAKNEICYQHDLWSSRGLLSYYLQQIAFSVAEVDISSCT
jgi:hypothetical protein